MNVILVFASVGLVRLPPGPLQMLLLNLRKHTVMLFCFEYVDCLQDDHAVEASQFVVEGDQCVGGRIIFGGCHFHTLPVTLLSACVGCEKAH
jgi:hypothetical protein